MQKDPLSSVDGNTLLIPLEDPDKFHCKECDCNVYEDEWNSKRGMCYSCWWKI